MEIKQATSYYLVDLLFLLKECVEDMNSRGLKQWNSANPGAAVIKEDINKGTLYFYSELGIVHGMINLTDEKPKEYDDVSWKSDGGKILYVNRLAVHPLYLESDVSDKLLKFTEEYAKKNKYTSIRLDVLDSYPVDNKFFVARKFESAGNYHTDFQKMPYVCFEKDL
jgi:GNAT superfamily N-acetyltransferase